MYPTGGGGAVGGYGAGTVVKAQHLKANFSITVTPILAATIPRLDFFIIIFFLNEEKNRQHAGYARVKRRNGTTPRLLVVTHCG